MGERGGRRKSRRRRKKRRRCTRNTAVFPYSCAYSALGCCCPTACLSLALALAALPSTFTMARRRQVGRRTTRCEILVALLVLASCCCVPSAEAASSPKKRVYAVGTFASDIGRQSIIFVMARWLDSRDDPSLCRKCAEYSTINQLGNNILNAAWGSAGSALVNDAPSSFSASGSPWPGPPARSLANALSRPILQVCPHCCHRSITRSPVAELT